MLRYTIYDMIFWQRTDFEMAIIKMVRWEWSWVAQSYKCQSEYFIKTITVYESKWSFKTSFTLQYILLYLWWQFFACKILFKKKKICIIFFWRLAISWFMSIGCVSVHVNENIIQNSPFRYPFEYMVFILSSWSTCESSRWKIKQLESV